MSKSDIKILLVEDEQLLQYVFEQQMNKLGFNVHKIVGNGQDAVDEVVADGYNLVFMDVRMPILDGLNATQRIRTAEKALGKYTPIIGLTAFAHRGKCIQFGMDDFLQKPVTLEELEEVITKWAVEHKRAEVQIKEGALPVKPEDFDPITERLKAIKSRISNLRETFEL